MPVPESNLFAVTKSLPVVDGLCANYTLFEIFLV